jgi:hypothetical protein
MNNYPPSQQLGQREEVVLENPSFYGRMKDRADRAKNAAYSMGSSMGRGIKGVGSYAYNQVPGRNGNYNHFTQTTSTPFGAVSNTSRMQNLGAAASAAGQLFGRMFTGQGGRTRKIKRKLRKTKTKKSRKRRVTRKRK